MTNNQFAMQDIIDNFDTATLKRGEPYYRDGSVLECKVHRSSDGESLEIISTVIGSKRYHQETSIYHDGKEVVIDGGCSCPVGYNCKHVVAAVLYVLYEDHPNRYQIAKDNERQPEELWLEKFIAMQSKKKIDLVPDDDYFLAYRLFIDNYGDNELNFYKTKMLKNGNVSRGSKLSNDSYLHAYNYKYNYTTKMDEQLAALFHSIATGYRRDIVFREEYGAFLLKKIIHTGRCFFKESERPLKWLAQKKPLHFAWQEENELSWLRPNIEEDEVILPNVIPPLCIDLKNSTVYELQTEYNSDTLKFLFNAPKLPSSRVNALVQEVMIQLPEVEFPLPDKLDIEELTVEPTPYLYLWGQKNPQGKTIHLMQLSFEYAGHRFDSSSRASANMVTQEGKNIKIQRDVITEKRCRERIESLGFTYEPHPEIQAYLSLAQPNMQVAIERWRYFTEEVLESIENEGWQVEIDSSFQYKFEYMESITLDVNHADESNEWFDLTFAVDIGGRKLELLPIVAPLLREFDSVESLPEYLNLEMETGGYLHIDSKEIKPILKTIFELFDKQQDDKLVIRPYDAHLLDVDADIEWKGAKELKALAQKLRDFKGIERIDPSPNLQATLREYQQFGLDWLNFLHEFRFGGVLADDMGLGKTIQTLAFLQRLKERGALTKPTLIIMPTSLIGNWKSEIKKFTPELTYLELYGIDRAEKFAQINDHDIVLTTYSLAGRDEEQYLKEHFYYIILDEAQKIKNPKTKVSLAIKQFKSEHRLALSGTPIENHLGELWSIFDFLMGGFLDNLTTFRTLFQTPIEKEHDIKRRELLNRKVAPFILRRTKEEVVLELPPKTEIIKRATFDTKQAKLYENIRITMEQKVREAIKGKGLSRSHITILDALLKLRQICCHPQLLKLESAKKVKESAKLEMFLELIDTLHEEGKKVLVFSQFTSMLAIIETQLKKRKIAYTKLTGATQKREEAIAQFREGEAKIFLISLKAGGVGLNLVEADTVIHYDPWWNPAVENQATDRAYRIGQDKPVFVYKLIVENSIEEKILQLQERKKSLQAGIYRGNEEKSHRFDGEELVELLTI